MNTRKFVKGGIAAVAALVTVGAIAMLLRQLNAPDRAPARQVARIAVLPDTPPPPPPPPPPKPETAEAPKPQAPVRELPQPVPAPAQAPLKMDGPAGDGPSAFAAGTVTQDYTGGPPTVGGGGAASAPAVADRAAERLYAGTVRQLLRDALEQHLAAEAGELTASFAVWVGADGRISRYELDPLAAESQAAPMRQALEDSARSLRLPPPPAARRRCASASRCVARVDPACAAARL